MPLLYTIVGMISLFIAFPNPYLHVGFFILVHLMSLYLIAKYSKRVFWHAFICSVGGSSIAMYYFYYNAIMYGGLAWYGALFNVIGIGLYVGIWAVFFACIMNKFMIFSPFWRAFAAAIVFYLLELVRTFLFTGYPWLVASSAMASYVEFIQLASIVGAIGLSGLYAGIAALLAEGIAAFLSPHTSDKRAKTCLLLGMVFLGGIYLFGHVRMENSFEKNNFLYGLDTTKPFKILEKYNNRNNEKNSLKYHNDPKLVGESKHILLLPNFIAQKSDSQQEFYQQNLLLFTTIQGNISQSIKWNTEYQVSSIQKYLRISSEGETFIKKELGEKFNAYPHIYLLPETALPFYYYHDLKLSKLVDEFFKKKNALLGAVGKEVKNPNGKNFREIFDIYSRIYFLQPNKQISYYDKRHLVPYGEYIPNIPILSTIFGGYMQGSSDFSSGDPNRSLVFAGKYGDIRFSTLVCFEVIFPYLAQKDMEKGAEIFINSSNEAWYGTTGFSKQHLFLGLMRSVEYNRFLVRASNTGINAIVDNYGRILSETDLFEDASLSAFVIPKKDMTIYFYLYPYLPYLVLFIFLLLCYKYYNNFK